MGKLVDVDEIKMSDLCVKCKNYHNGEKTVNCKSYITPEFSCYKEKPEQSCNTCKHLKESPLDRPCLLCGHDGLIEFYRSKWEPAEPTLKEVTERMQSEFDATGKDVKIFMNERIIKR